MSIILQESLAVIPKEQGQSRKGTDIGYISHPFEVAQILTAAGCDTELIIAGLLHDVLEDTTVTPETIEREFGPFVLSLVPDL